MSFARIPLGLAAAAIVLQAAPAFAQAGSAGPLPGTVDATKAPDMRRDRELRDQAVANNVGEVGKSKKKGKAEADNPVPATPADVTVGASVSDLQGVLIGTIESVDAAGAVIASGDARAKLALEVFGKNSKGLLLNLTKAEYDSKVGGTN